MSEKRLTGAWRGRRLFVSIGVKTFLAFLLIVAVLVSGLYYFATVTFSAHVDAHAIVNVKSKTQGTWRLYYTRLDQMMYGALQAASLVTIKQALRDRDGDYLQETLSNYTKVRQYVDLWVVVDANRQVIGVREGTATGDLLEVNGMVGAAISMGKSVLATELVSREFLSRESAQLAARVESSGLMQIAVVPIVDEGIVTGAFVLGTLLDGAPWLSASTYEYFNVSAAILTLEGHSRARMVSASNQENTIFGPLTCIPREAVEAVQLGKTYAARTQIDSTSVFLVVEPISDVKGTVIGAIAVAEYDSKARDYVDKLASGVLGAAVVGLLISLLLWALVFRRTSKPFKALKAALDATARGDLAVEVDIRTRDESQQIGRGLNQMIEAVRVREARLDSINQISKVLIQLIDPELLLDKALSKIIELTHSLMGRSIPLTRRRGS